MVNVKYETSHSSLQSDQWDVSAKARSTKYQLASRSQSPAEDGTKSCTLPQMESCPTVYPRRYKTNSSRAPPCATASYLCEDNGNASPRHIRLTAYKIPCYGELADRINLSLGAVIQPFAAIPVEEETDNVVTHSPIRCSFCGAYVNPHTRWLERGSYFQCNFCSEENESPATVETFDGRRIKFWTDDYGKKPDGSRWTELKYGFVEYVAPKDYLPCDANGDPLKVCPGILFAIDVSHQSIMSGLLKSIIIAITDILDEMRQNLESWGLLRFGVITYDDKVHFHMYENNFFCVPDVDDPFSPLPESKILFELGHNDTYAAFSSFLRGLPELFKENEQIPDQQHCVGAVMQAGREVLASTGGKVILFQTGFSAAGAGSQKRKYDPTVLGTIAERDLFRGSFSFWNELACLSTEHNSITVAFDVFVCTADDVDLAEIGEVTRATGGQLYFYQNYEDTVDSKRLYYDLKQNITRFTGFNAIMVVRVSEGLEVKEQMGLMTVTENKEIILPVITSDSTLCVSLNVCEPLEGCFLPCIQTAIIYTNIFSETIIRVQTLKICVVNSAYDLFMAVDLWAVCKFSLCQIAWEILNPLGEDTIQMSRDRLLEACTEMLSAYRKFCSNDSSTDQLVLPEKLRLLPLIIFSLMKHKILTDGVHPDVRVFHLLISLSNSCKSAAAYTYPHLYSLCGLKSWECTIDKQTNQICWPLPGALSKKTLKDHGLYLINTGVDIWIVLGDALSEEVISEVFLADENGNIVLREEVPDDPHNISRKIQLLVEEIRWNQAYYQPVRIVQRPVSKRSRDTTAEQRQLLSILIQDRQRQASIHCINEQNYIHFLIYLHYQILHKLGYSNALI